MLYIVVQTEKDTFDTDHKYKQIVTFITHSTIMPPSCNNIFQIITRSHFPFYELCWRDHKGVRDQHLHFKDIYLLSVHCFFLRLFSVCGYWIFTDFLFEMVNLGVWFDQQFYRLLTHMLLQSSMEVDAIFKCKQVDTYTYSMVRRQQLNLFAMMWWQQN